MKLYTTSEYLDVIKFTKTRHEFNCEDSEFRLFHNKKAADYDAQWLVDYYKKEGKKIKKPVVYRVRLERVK